MSKPHRSFLLMILVAILMPPVGLLYAQSAAIDVKRGGSPSVSIELQGINRRNLSFNRSVAGISNLQQRFSNIRLADSISGSQVGFRELQPGEYLAERDFSIARYDVDLTPLAQRQAAAHTSWMKDDVGILMLEDLLPIGTQTPLVVSFPGDAPIPYSIYFTDGAKKALLHDPKSTVFYAGTGWRIRATHRCRECPVLFLSGAWHFTDEEALDFAGSIAEEYQKLFRSPNLPHIQIGIAKFTVPTEPGVWQAETRGRNVTIISSDMPFRTQSVQRLHEQLRHEIFHLWIPNGVNLTGNYDWFYEGFALYQSLKLAVSLNRIRFDDFLDTLSRAHTIDSAYTQRPSLIEASKNRFGGADTQVYARGMLVAFLTDIALMNESKNSVEDFLRGIYAKHRKPSQPADGNQVVMDMMKANAALEPIVRRYVAGSETIAWKSQIATAGIEDTDTGPITTLRVTEKPNGRQKAILDKLGYNSWRKLPVTRSK